MWQRCIHYVASDKPVGTVLKDNKKSNVCVSKSAGHPKHEYTTGYSYDEIVKQFGF
jgi:hypothetical protein